MIESQNNIPKYPDEINHKPDNKILQYENLKITCHWRAIKLVKHIHCMVEKRMKCSNFTSKNSSAL